MDRQRRFTGRQITTTVVAVSIAAVLAPVGAMAATGSLVNITDPVTSSYKARVNSLGGLAVTPKDPVSGVQARVNSSGQQLVSGSVAISNHPSITGTVGISGQPNVTTHPGLPGTPFAAWGSSIAVPAGKTLVVTTLSFQGDAVTTGGIEGFVQFQTRGSSAYVFMPLRYVYTDTTGYSFYVDTEATELYVDGGTSLTASTYGGSASLGSAFVGVSGYLI